MNKILKSVLLLSVITIVIAAFSISVNASTSFVLTPRASSSTEANTSSNETNNTTLTLGIGNSIPKTVEEANVSTNNTNTSNAVSNSTNNIVKSVSVNNINENVAKEDIPQTGENDLFIISAIGIVAIVVGSISFVKSRK